MINQVMKYEEIELLKQSEKSTVHLVREKEGERVFIRKILKGKHPIYETLQNYEHPCLPKLYEVVITEDSTTIMEEYIEGESAGSTELSEKQLIAIVKDMCSVLEFLHGKGIIHRDIKPSNMIFAKDGHIRLIDFDAARMPKEDLEQDTKLLGTRGYAPPEQYGFAQTDERADIYALGVTLEQLLGEKANKPRYKKIIRKCTDLNPDKRYQSVRQVKRAFFHTERRLLYAAAAVLLIILIWNITLYQTAGGDGNVQSDNTELPVLPAPENPHWDGESGIALWGNVAESGYAEDDDDVAYRWRLYRMDTETPPDLDTDEWYNEGEMSGNGQEEEAFFDMNLASYLYENGFYYFAVASYGYDTNDSDSPYVLSDAFEYTGEFAPELPVPEDLEWRVYDNAEGEDRYYWATWGNLDDYEDADSFNVCVYDKNGDYVMNNIWTKEYIMEAGYDGINIRREFLAEKDGKYRFTVQALTSRPNEYRSSPMPDPVPEEYFSPWYYK